MSWGIFSEISRRSGILDRRFIIGALFPALIGCISLHVIFWKNLPEDLISWIYIGISAFVFSFFSQELSPKLCWYISRSGKFYESFLLRNLKELFISPLEDKLKHYNIDIDIYEQKILNEVTTFRDYAKQEYISNFFIPERRYNHELLILSETRFLLLLNTILMAFINLILLINLVNAPLDLIIYTRDEITSEIGLFLIIVFLSLIFGSLLIILYQTRAFWIIAIRSTNVPFLESERERNIRECRMESILTFEEESRAIYGKEIHDPPVKNSLESLAKEIITEEYKYRTKSKLRERYYLNLFNKWSEELKISKDQVSELSKKLSRLYSLERELPKTLS